ncbi:MAG: hypothetical protein JWN14_4825, partial [Chthonomonadales bacterium]|nr:hypothetical protein [Chthonomonadales bacterium]
MQRKGEEEKRLRRESLALLFTTPFSLKSTGSDHPLHFFCIFSVGNRKRFAHPKSSFPSEDFLHSFLPAFLFVSLSCSVTMEARRKAETVY